MTATHPALTVCSLQRACARRRVPELEHCLHEVKPAEPALSLTVHETGRAHQALGEVAVLLVSVC